VVLMETLSETYSRPLTPLMLEGYWMALSDLDESELAAAAKLALRMCKYMPTPADLRGFIRDVRGAGLAIGADLLLEGQRNLVHATPEQLAELHGSWKKYQDQWKGHIERSAQPAQQPDMRLPPGDRE